MPEKGKQNIGSGAGVEDWLDCTDEMVDMTYKDDWSLMPWLNMLANNLAKYQQDDSGLGEGFATNCDGKIIYDSKRAAIKFLDLAGYSSNNKEIRNLYEVGVGLRIDALMHRHIIDNKCEGGWYFIESNEIEKIVDIGCSACDITLRSIYIG